ncbi:Hypothetical protein CINCED_3A019997 [Cinara cedri]|uniref:Uncharacterized protein n=1 Tax=Cinara cedri TaxID=506608 RepID=A0A5E4NFB9_9HEMI|nr:Hypothetical protein CINCED_3A019997 [Cinara cedri]
MSNRRPIDYIQKPSEPSQPPTKPPTAEAQSSSSGTRSDTETSNLTNLFEAQLHVDKNPTDADGNRRRDLWTPVGHKSRPSPQQRRNIHPDSQGKASGNGLSCYFVICSIEN